MSCGEFEGYKRQVAREYLLAVADATAAARALREEIDGLDYSDVHAVDYTRARSGLAPDRDRIARVIERRDELLASYSEQLEDALQTTADAHRALSGMPQPYRALLTYRYLQGMDWRSVADALSFNADYCRKDLHAAALAMMYDRIPGNELPEAI